MNSRYDVEISSLGACGIVGFRAGEEGRRRIASLLGVSLPKIPYCADFDGGRLLPLANDEWLAFCDDEEQLFHNMDGALEGTYGVVPVVSDAYQGFSVRGPHATDVMAQTVAIDLTLEPDIQPYTWGKTGVGRASGVVVRNGQLDDFSIYVDNTHARYAQTLLSALAGTEVSR